MVLSSLPSVTHPLKQTNKQNNKKTHSICNPLRKYFIVDSTTLEINTLHTGLSELCVSRLFYWKCSLNINTHFCLRSHILWIYLHRIQLHSLQLIFRTSTKSRQYRFLSLLIGTQICCLQCSCFPFVNLKWWSFTDFCMWCW